VLNLVPSAKGIHTRDLLDSQSIWQDAYRGCEVVGMAEQSTAHLERRGTRRFALSLPLSIVDPSGTKKANTRDISARGVSFFTDTPLAEGAELSFTLTLTSEVTLTEDVNVQCFGRVLRTDHATDGGSSAVAAIIERYEFLGRN